MPQLDVNTYVSQLFWLAVTFGFLYVLVKTAILPKLGEVLENRQRRIADDLEMAERLQREAQDTLKDQEALLAGARAEAQELVRTEKEKVLAEVEAKRKELEEALARKIADAEKSLQESRRKAMQELEGTVGELAAEIAARVAGKAPSEKALKAALARRQEEG